ncbi:hypothetical protein ALQ31_05608 [Pseudomonas amygdali pv. morsprunorum]|nr:hypothetical protein ALQ31_05608 [Pseudomonas amygdali pv. morsprunorum]
MPRAATERSGQPGPASDAVPDAGANRRRSAPPESGCRWLCPNSCRKVLWRLKIGSGSTGPQAQGQQRTAAGMVGEQQFAAQRAHQRIADGQTKAKPLGAGLGRKEGLASPCQRFLGKTGAVVTNVQVNALSGLLDTYPQPARRAFLGEGVQRVGEQIAEHLTQAGFTGLHPDRGVRQVTDQFDFHGAPPLGQQRQRIFQRRLQCHAFRGVAVATGEGAQVRDDRGHAPCQFADQLEVAACVLGALMIEQHFGVFGVTADGGQRLIQLMADTRRHGAQRRQFAGLHQFVLGLHQLLLRLFALQHFLTQPAVEPLQIAGPLDNPHLQFAARLGLESDAVQIMTTTLHHQAQQQHQHQQRCAANRHHRAHLTVDKGARRENVDVPAGFFDGLGLGQPGVFINPQGPRIAGRVGLDRDDGLFLVIGQVAGRPKAPLRVGGQDYHAVLIGQQQLLGRLAPQGFGVVQINLDHQYADDPLTITHRAGKKVTTFGRGRAEAEEPPGSARPCINEVGPEREVSANEAVLLLRVRGRQGQAVCVHQVHDIGTGLTRDFAEQTVGVRQGGCVARRRQCGAQSRQVAENLWQGFVTVQGAEQVGDVQVQSLAVLIGQHVAVIPFGQVFQRPQQRRQTEGQKGEAAPARAARQCGSHGHRWAVAEGLAMPADDKAGTGNRNTRSILTWASGAYYARRRLVRHPDIAPGGL